MKKILFFLTFFLFLIFSGFSQKPINNQQELKLAFLPFSLEYDYFYVDVWASWCGPCIANLKFLNRLSSNPKFSSVKFVTLNIDKDIQKGIDFREKYIYDNNILNLRLGEEINPIFIEENKIKLIPRYIIFDRNRIILKDYCSGPSNPRLIEEINALTKLKKD